MTLLLVVMLLLLVMAVLFLLVTLAHVILFAHAESNLTDSFTGYSDAACTVTALIWDGKNEISLVRISVPGFNPSRTVSCTTDSSDSIVNVTGSDLGGDHVVFATNLGVIAPILIISDNLEFRSSALFI